ncbi:DUF3310 domain-containing protein [Shewanella gaetbuli]|uniref:DUF3310 domain-containing protein n=1 Tax=Shewanella gaetbuli TaxID=220752 RepID=A0A9X1ZNP2_9GAMM|nr:DUF3310 domain-containing protein [Shewanella gaetbuli]MCL1142942.1 DUF3310 domain-containing protein [Shewanella gaetbuli]
MKIAKNSNTQLNAQKKNRDVARQVNPEHYTFGLVECITFNRFMPYSIGCAFKYLWRLGRKDDETIELGKISWYVRDSLKFRPRPTINAEFADVLIRELSLMEDEFEHEVYKMLVGLISAAAGDFELLECLAEEYGFLNDAPIAANQEVYVSEA